MGTCSLKSISDQLLMEACIKAKELNLECNFIELLEEEIVRRDLYIPQFFFKEDDHIMD